jgi:hypothetical protein
VFLKKKMRKEARKDPNLVVFERFQAWLLMECSMFVSLWKEMGLGFTFLRLSTPKDFT